jgi:DNA helicase MCM8
MRFRFISGLPEYATYFSDSWDGSEGSSPNSDFRLAITANILSFLLSEEGCVLAVRALDRYEQAASALGVPSLVQMLRPFRPKGSPASPVCGISTDEAVLTRESHEGDGWNEASNGVSNGSQRTADRYCENDGFSAPRALMSAVDEIALPVDHMAFVRSHAMRTFAEALVENPEESLYCLGLALVQAVKILSWFSGTGSYANRPWVTIQPDELAEHLAMVQLPPTAVRLYDLERFTDLSDLRAHAVGRLVQVRGTVIRISSIRQQLTSIKVTCAVCGKTQPVPCPNFQYKAPVSCTASAECKSRILLPDRSSATTLDWQRVRLQELSSTGGIADIGGIPRTIDCELTHTDMLDTVIPGDIIDVVGIVKFLNLDADASRSRRGKDHALYQIYLHVVSLVASRDAKRSNRSECGNGAIESDLHRSSPGEAPETLQFSQVLGDRSKTPAPTGIGNRNTGPVPFPEADLESIREILQHRRHLFEYLVHSLCPLICGHDVIKAALLLGIMGGSKRQNHTRLHSLVASAEEVRDQAPELDVLAMLCSTDAPEMSASLDSLAARSDIHVLIVGDPGVGKSQMLRAAAALLPRSVYVCGNTTTTSGLTVTVSREAGSGEYVLEAGALVLADRGVCCIDEFDKMSADYQALLEAMEQQSISVAKAGIIGTLSARAAILAAANPVGGHYDKRRTVCENLKMSPALLSRFDLVFVVQDEPDQRRDQRISEHVMATFGGRRQRAAPMRWSVSTESSDECSPLASKEQATSASNAGLIERLQKTRDWAQKPVAARALRKYISFARQCVHPVLSSEAKRVLRDFYLLMRRNAHAHAGIHSVDALPPVTTRQLESLKRLAQARARAELRPIVSAQDARDVIEMMQCSMLDVYSDERGVLDFSRVGGTSRANDVRRFLSVLHAEASRRQNAQFHVDELQQLAHQHGIQYGGDFAQFVDMLNLQGFLLQRAYRYYRLQSSDFAATGNDRTTRRLSG